MSNPTYQKASPAPLDQTVKKPIKRALVSVYDKAHLEILANTFIKYGIECVSTGSTAATLTSLGVNVQKVEEVTNFPECLDGRVKTLHPNVHAGILADLRLSTHTAQIDELGVQPFDLVVVNLYPFSDTVASGASFAECIEKIDIGGPSMVRGAAKNFANVVVVTNPSDYDQISAQIADGGLTEFDRFRYAQKAFEHTAAYDVAIANWLSKIDPTLSDEEGHHFGHFEGATYEVVKELRYGENAHQNAVILRDVAGQNTVPKYGTIVDAKLLSHGKEMSYNNYIDAEAALRACYDHDEPCVAIIKHANPCGIAIADNIEQAYKSAFDCDPVSAFGGVIAANRTVTKAMADAIKPVFTEVVIAPNFEEEALEILLTKKALRILQNVPPTKTSFSRPNARNAESLLEAKKITGGLLVQERDMLDAFGDNPENWKLVAGDKPSADVMRDLIFAWRTVRAVKSNAILLANEGATVGIGMGQVNRLDSCNLAVERANTLGVAVQGAQSTTDTAGGAENVTNSSAPQRSKGSVAASDAFFPFADGLQILINAGVKAVVQPGGSIRDEDVIKAANDAGITMFLTGTRHFNH